MNCPWGNNVTTVSKMCTQATGVSSCMVSWRGWSIGWDDSDCASAGCGNGMSCRCTCYYRRLQHCLLLLLRAERVEAAVVLADCNCPIGWDGPDCASAGCGNGMSCCCTCYDRRLQLFFPAPPCCMCRGRRHLRLQQLPDRLRGLRLRVYWLRQRHELLLHVLRSPPPATSPPAPLPHVLRPRQPSSPPTATARSAWRTQTVRVLAAATA